MRRILCILMLCLMLPASVLGEDALTLITADTVPEVKQFVILPKGDGLPEVQPGMVRYVSLNEQDTAFRYDFWANDHYNLTEKEDYRSNQRGMHTRSAYCMALSYLGIDVTPVMMSELANSRDVAAPFDQVTEALGGLERIQPVAYVFDTMVENYLNDTSYSPVVCEIRRPDGNKHTVLIVGFIPSTGGFIICDPAAPKKDGETLHTYNMCWHVRREAVLFSDFYDKFYESEVLALYQWHLVDKE